MDICDQILVGNGQSILQIKQQISQAAKSDFNVIISGETEVRKEPAVQALHLMSSCSKYPLVKVNCAVIPGELLENELPDISSIVGAVKTAWDMNRHTLCFRLLNEASDQNVP